MEKTLGQIPSDCLKIVLFGPESSGKTTLANQLAASYKTQWVPEFMRTYAQNKWETTGTIIEKEDLLSIAQGQIDAENELSMVAHKILFCDTNLLELKVYSEYYFDGYCPSEIVKACEENHYDHYFLTQVDVPWQADDLRDRPYDREKLFRIFERELLINKLPFTLLEGTEEERLRKAAQVLATMKT